MFMMAGLNRIQVSMVTKDFIVVPKNGFFKDLKIKLKEADWSSLPKKRGRRPNGVGRWTTQGVLGLELGFSIKFKRWKGWKCGQEGGAQVQDFSSDKIKGRNMGVFNKFF